MASCNQTGSSNGQIDAVPKQTEARDRELDTGNRDESNGSQLKPNPSLTAPAGTSRPSAEAVISTVLCSTSEASPLGCADKL